MIKSIPPNVRHLDIFQKSVSSRPTNGTKLTELTSHPPANSCPMALILLVGCQVIVLGAQTDRDTAIWSKPSWKGYCHCTQLFVFAYYNQIDEKKQDDLCNAASSHDPCTGWLELTVLDSVWVPIPGLYGVTIFKMVSEIILFNESYEN